jgi:hypothetical protein
LFNLAFAAIKAHLITAQDVRPTRVRRAVTKLSLIDNWKKAHHLTSVQLCAFWGAFNGAVIGLSAFSGFINPWLFLGLNVIGYATIAMARITKQPGLD